MKQIIKDALILFAITAVAGVLLALVNEVTKEPIAEQQMLRQNQAFMAVFSEADHFEVREVPDMTAPEYEVFQTEHPFSVIEGINVAYDAENQVAGYVLTVTNKEGYGGDIRFVMGLQPDGTLNGISILETSETAGLGLEAQTVLAPQFAGKKAAAFTYTKTGSTAESEVDAISSATITTNAVVNGVNAGLDYFYSYLMGGMISE